MKPHEPRRRPLQIHAISSRDGDLSPLLRQAHRLRKLNLQLQRHLPAHLARHVRLCNIRKNGLAVMAVPSQAAAGQIYLQQHTLLEALQAMNVPVTSIKLRVQPGRADASHPYRSLPGLWSASSTGSDER